jgi:hypothetical protein
MNNDNKFIGGPEDFSFEVNEDDIRKGAENRKQYEAEKN